MNQWAVYYPPLKSVWRVRNGDVVALWEIQELEFYKRVDCADPYANPLLRTVYGGTPIDTNRGVNQEGRRQACEVLKKSACNLHAFDGNPKL